MFAAHKLLVLATQASTARMDQVLYDRIVSQILRTGKLPEGFTSGQRASLRLESKNYAVERGQLFYERKKV